MYANSRFPTETDEWGRVHKYIEPGEKISKSDLGVDDDEWNNLIELGAVVESYPEGLDPQTPPAEYYRDNPDAAPEAPEPEKAPEPEPEKAPTTTTTTAPTTTTSSQGTSAGKATEQK